MREAIGGTWMMGIVVFFIVLFTGYLALSVNHSRAFNVKNAIIEIIEKHDGHTICAQEEIRCYLLNVGYATGGNCTALPERADNEAVLDQWNDNVWEGQGSFTGGSAYCLMRHETRVVHRQAYYSVAVFFRVDLPILRGVFNFPIFGETRTINHPRDESWPSGGLTNCPPLPAHLHHVCPQ